MQNSFGGSRREPRLDPIISKQAWLRIWEQFFFSLLLARNSWNTCECVFLAKNGKDSSHVYHLQFLFWIVAGLGRRLWIGEGQSGNEITHSGQEPNWQFRYHWYTMIISMDLHNDQSWFCNEEFLNLGLFFSGAQIQTQWILTSIILTLIWAGSKKKFPLVHSGLNSEIFCVLQVWVLLNTKQWLGGLSTRMCLITFSRTSKWYVSPLEELSFLVFVSWCYGSLLTHVWISEIYCPVDKPFNIEMVVCSQKSGLVWNVAFLVSVFMLFGSPGCSSKCGFWDGNQAWVCENQCNRDFAWCWLGLAGWLWWHVNSKLQVLIPKKVCFSSVYEKGRILFIGSFCWISIRFFHGGDLSSEDSS